MEPKKEIKDNNTNLKKISENIILNYIKEYP